MSRFNKMFAFVSFLGMLLTGCSLFPTNNGNNDGEGDHLHHLIFKHDFELHWAECDSCGHKYDIYDDERIYDDDSKKLINSYDRWFLGGEPHILENTSENDIVCRGCKAHFRFLSGHDENQHWEAITDLDYGTSEERLRENHHFDEEVINPTYESLGYTIKTCDECGYSYNTDYVDKLEHHYSDLQFDSEHHWRQCTDVGYGDLIIDYSKHKYGEVIHRYKEGDIQGDYTYHTCECGYQENIEYEYSPLELQTAEYLSGIQLQDNSWWYAIQLNDKAKAEKPELLVIPPYLDGYLVNGISYRTSGIEYGLSALENGFVKKIYLPISLYEKSPNGINDGNFKKCLDELEKLEEVHCHPSSDEMREENGVVYCYDTAYFFLKSKESITLRQCDSVYSYSSSDVTKSIFYDRPNLKHVYVDDSCGSIYKLTLSELNNYPNILLNEKPGALYLGNGINNDYSYCLGSNNDSIENVHLETSCRIIGQDAYNNFSNLSQIEINNNIVEIGSGAFENCTSISRVSYLGTIESWNSVINYGFRGVSNLVIHCIDGDVTL